MVLVDMFFAAALSFKRSLVTTFTPPLCLLGPLSRNMVGAYVCRAAPQMYSTIRDGR
jgi:hypothetical protein